MKPKCTIRTCDNPVDDEKLHCYDCRNGRYPETRSATVQLERTSPAKLIDPRSEEEIKAELVAWCYLKGAVKVIDTEQGYRPDKCKHCGGDLGAGNATTRIERGFPDLIVFWPAPKRTWWIEAKSAKGKQTEHQIKFEQWVRAAGEIYAVVRSINELEELLAAAGLNSGAAA